MKFRTAVILPDIHYPEHSPVAIDLVKKFIKDVQPDEIIYQGDNLDMGVISHWNKDKKKTLELKRLKNDYDGFIKDVLDPIESLSKKKTKFVWLNGNHECLDTDTELLTRRGWIKEDEIDSKNDKVFSHNPQTGIGEWVNIDRVVRYDFEGNLNKITSNVIDLKATDEHKIYSINKNGFPEYTEIRNLSGKRYNIPVTAKSGKEDCQRTDDEIRYAAWILTDGSIDRYGAHTIYQSKDISGIIALLRRLGFEHSVDTRNRKIKEICGVKLKSVKPQHAIRILKDSRRSSSAIISSKKYLPWWVEELSDRQFKIFISSLVDGDGSRHLSSPDSSWMLYGEKWFLEEVQKQCLLHNVAASLSVYREGKKNEGYRLNLAMDRETYKFEKTNDNLSKEYYKGIVWDLTVKHHNFMVRRNGKCHFTGNSWADQYIDKNPEMEGMIEPEVCLNLEDRGYTIVPFNEVYRLGKLNIIHGYYHSKYHASKTLDVFEESICYGHMHSPQMHSKVKPMDSKDFHASYGLPCLCELAPDYMKNRPNAWINGFGVVHVMQDGSFNLYPIIIVNNKFIYNGKIYESNKKTTL